jgi:hypothetical protein
VSISDKLHKVISSPLGMVRFHPSGLFHGRGKRIPSHFITMVRRRQKSFGQVREAELYQPMLIPQVAIGIAFCETFF